MVRAVIESVRSLALGVRAHLFKIGALGVVSSAMTFFADVLGRQDGLLWTLAAIAGVAGAMLFLFLVIAMVGHLRRVRAAAPAGTRVRAGELSGGIAWLRDLTLFSAMTAALMGATGVGQHYLAKPDEPSLFASLLPELKGIRADMKTLKRETSDDPRKELANLGVQWGTQAFADALISGDERSVKLFLQGGMSATTRHRGASAICFALQPGAERPVAMLELLIANGYDVNATLIDPTIMRAWGSTVPPHFEAPGLPAEYAAWQRTFAGPALLWITIRSAYAGPREEDRQMAAILRKAGAKLDLPRAFILATRDAWGTTASHRQAAMMLR